jgi:osmotically-inducible protein OsmY
MNLIKEYLPLLVVAAGSFTGCSTTTTKAVDVSDSVRTSLDRAGLKDVKVSQDRDKGVVSLTGHVATSGDKSNAAAIAQAIAPAQVVSNEIAVITPGAESDSKAVNSELDKGIEHNLDAALIRSNLHDNVKYKVKNHVVTLTGEVNSQSLRALAESVAAAVQNVQQVVNELQVKGQKATSNK